MGITIGTINVRGTVLKGLDDASPEERVAQFEFPGIDGVGEIGLGLRSRQIVVPMNLHPYSIAELAALETQLTELRRTGQAFTLSVSTPLRVRTFANCKLRAIVPRTDVLPDVANTVGGGVFAHRDFVFVQLKV